MSASATAAISRTPRPPGAFNGELVRITLVRKELEFLVVATDSFTMTFFKGGRIDVSRSLEEPSGTDTARYEHGELIGLHCRGIPGDYYYNEAGLLGGNVSDRSSAELHAHQSWEFFSQPNFIAWLTELQQNPKIKEQLAAAQQSE